MPKKKTKKKSKMRKGTAYSRKSSKTKKRVPSAKHKKPAKKKAKSKKKKAPIEPKPPGEVMYRVTVVANYYQRKKGAVSRGRGKGRKRGSAKKSVRATQYFATKKEAIAAKAELREAVDIVREEWINTEGSRSFGASRITEDDIEIRPVSYDERMIDIGMEIINEGERNK